MIGLVGGMSWRSTALYYSLLNELGEKRDGDHSNPRSLIVSLRYADLLEAAGRGEWNAVEDAIAYGLVRLQQAGALLGLITAVTAHRLFDSLQKRTSLRLLHVLDPAMASLAASGARRVAVLGTSHTLSAPFLAARSEAAGLQAIVPNERMRQKLDEVIQGDLTLGRISDQTQAAARDVAAELLSRGADAILLACTELPLLNWRGLSVADAVRLHVSAALDTGCKEFE